MTLDRQVHHHPDTRHGTAEDNSYLCNENIQHKGKKKKKRKGGQGDDRLAEPLT